MSDDQPPPYTNIAAPLGQITYSVPSAPPFPDTVQNYGEKPTGSLAPTSPQTGTVYFRGGG